jgi:cytoskeletal protein CcmA (bactofilin family)
VGNINCKNVDIEGIFHGIIQVSGMLNVKSKASIKGEVTVGKLSVEPGADFSASCVMKINDENMLLSDGKETQQKTS